MAIYGQFRSEPDQVTADFFKRVSHIFPLRFKISRAGRVERESHVGAENFPLVRGPTKRRLDACRENEVLSESGRGNASCSNPPAAFLGETPATATTRNGSIETGIKLGTIIAIHAIRMGS